MTLTLNEKEKKAIASAVTERIDEYLSRFPFARYPTDPLEEWRQTFCDPKAVPTETLKQALGWQLGGWQQRSPVFPPQDRLRGRQGLARLSASRRTRPRANARFLEGKAVRLAPRLRCGCLPPPPSVARHFRDRGSLPT